MKKKTVGQWSKELLEKSDDKHTIEDQMREQLSDYDKELYLCFDNNKNKYKGIFYLVVLTRADKLLKNVLRHQYFTRISCPTPQYDQTVYQCHKDWTEPKFIWTLPNKEYAAYMLKYKEYIHPEEYRLLQYVSDHADGTLLKVVKRLNNEKDEKGFLILGV